LAPETLTTVTPWHQVTVSVVKIDPAIPQGERSNGQVYVVKGGKLALHKESLQRLADAAGARFRPTKLLRYDDGSFQADVIAEKQDPDGTWRQFPGSYYWNVPERVAAVKEPNTDKGKEDIKMIRTFAAQRAETGAISRAIRCILPIKQAYTPRELANPFIVARVVFNPWQDPVVAAAVILPDSIKARWRGKVRDSKQLSPGAREYLYDFIKEAAISIGIGSYSNKVIDSIGIARATRLAMIWAIEQLTPQPQYLLIDYVRLPEMSLPQKGITEGDSLCFSIACASIIAKVTRDRLVTAMDKDYPGYGFARHKGYGTREHLECLRKKGPCPLHRRTFSPVSEITGQKL
jgi:ribonuclease HII